MSKVIANIGGYKVFRDGRGYNVECRVGIAFSRPVSLQRALARVAKWIDEDHRIHADTVFRLSKVIVDQAPPSDREDRRGNCYVTCEALYHLFGEGPCKLTPATLKHEGETHWVLIFTLPGGDKLVLDPTAKQFKTKPDYRKARGRGFLTKEPSKRAKDLMERLLWQRK